jgi:hypothetical protein
MPAVAAAIAVATLALAPQAHAAGGVGGLVGGIAYANDTGGISNDIPGIGPYNFAITIQPGTSPAIEALPLYNNAYQMAFQTNSSELWTCGTLSCNGLGLGMMPGTSPAIAELSTGGYIIAFQANTGTLWTVATNAAPHNWGLPMNQHSSPSITTEPGGGYEIAYEANDNYLAIAGTVGTYSLARAMQPGTSPSITTEPGPGYEIAFQSSTSDLWVDGMSGTRDTGLGMNPTSSPAITSVVGNDTWGDYQVAFAANTNILWTYGSYGTKPLNQAIQPGTSPSIIGTFHPGLIIPGSILPPLTYSGYKIAFQNTGGTLSTYHGDLSDLIEGSTDTGLTMNTTSSPAIAPTGQ